MYADYEQNEISIGVVIVYTTHASWEANQKCPRFPIMFIDSENASPISILHCAMTAGAVAYKHHVIHRGINSIAKPTIGPWSDLEGGASRVSPDLVPAVGGKCVDCSALLEGAHTPGKFHDLISLRLCETIVLFSTMTTMILLIGFQEVSPNFSLAWQWQEAKNTCSFLCGGECP